MYFDSHAHYDFKPFDEDRDKLLGQVLPAAGVELILNVGTNMKSCRDSINLAKKYDYIYASVGIHPHNVKDMDKDGIQQLADMTLEPKVVAIGEIGLDYHYDFSPRDIQRKRFEEQLQLALDLQLPVIVHCREAHDDVLSILKNSGAGEKVGGVLHCFSGDAALAQKYFNLGWHIGIGGVVTYKNAGSLRDVAAMTPQERLLIETDCPYLSPEPCRGGRNDSSYLKHIVEKIAGIWGISHDKAAEISTNNAKRLFNINYTKA